MAKQLFYIELHFNYIEDLCSTYYTDVMKYMHHVLIQQHVHVQVAVLCDKATSYLTDTFFATFSSIRKEKEGCKKTSAQWTNLHSNTINYHCCEKCGAILLLVDFTAVQQLGNPG